jgi:hypothetical protein
MNFYNQYLRWRKDMGGQNEKHAGVIVGVCNEFIQWLIQQDYASNLYDRHVDNVNPLVVVPTQKGREFFGTMNT